MKRFAPVLVFWFFFWKIWSCMKNIIYLLWLRSKTHRYFQGTMFHLRMMSESVPTARFQQPLRWFEAFTKKISTMSSFPPPEVLSPVCVGCHPQPSEPPADWDQGRLLQPAVWVGCLPSPLTCAAQKGGWIMEQCSQEGFFFHSFPDQCVHGAAPVAYSTGKLSQELPHNSQKHGCSNKISTLEMRWNEQLGCGGSVKRNSQQLLRYNLRYWCQTVIIML